MKNILIAIGITLLFQIDLNAQNVGIGTTNPQAKLHVKSDLGLVTAFYEGFNEGVINPAYQKGDRDWKIITDDPPIGTYGVGSPSNFLFTETAILEFTVNTPVGKDVRISFSASHNDPGGKINFLVQKPGGLYRVDHEPSWRTYTTNFVATTNPSIIRFSVEAESTNAPNETWLDEISVTYASDPALMIDDGTQMSGGILQSDADGNASWVDLRGEIAQQVGDATQNLSFNSQLNILNIENGNGVRVTGLTNNQLKKFSMRSDTIISSPDMHFMIPSSQADKSALNYNPNRGSFSWGLSPQSDTYVDARNSVRWGKENKVYAEYASVWGQDNIIQFTGENATVYGNNNIVGGANSSVWGSDNTVDGQHNTVWGTNNLVTGDNSTVWGNNNSFDRGNSYTFAVGNFNTLPKDIEKNILLGNSHYPFSNESILIGQGLTSSSYREVVVGSFNTNAAGSQETWELYDRIFSVGNGSDGNSRNTAFVVTKNGNVGINTIVPQDPLDIQADINSIVGITIENDHFDEDSGAHILMKGKTQEIEFQGEFVQRNFKFKYIESFGNLYLDYDDIPFLTFDKEKKLGINKSIISYDLHLGNNSAAKPSSSSWTVASDRRLKENIHPFEGGLALIQKINPVWFTYNGRGGMPRETSVGTIAQELERIAPYMVSDWEREGEKYKAVDYGAMDFILVNAIKELDQKNKELRSEVEELKLMVQALLEKKEASTE